MNEQLNPKLEALMQLLGSEAAEKTVAKILESLTAEEKAGIVRQLVSRWMPSELETRRDSYSGNQLNDAGKELAAMFKTALAERKDELKAMMLARIDAQKTKWVEATVNKALDARGW